MKTDWESAAESTWPYPTQAPTEANASAFVFDPDERLLKTLAISLEGWPQAEGLASWLGRHERPATAWRAWSPISQATLTALLQVVVAAGAKQAQAVEDRLRVALGFASNLDDLCKKVNGLESMLGQILSKLEGIETGRSSAWIRLDSLGREAFRMLKPMNVILTARDGGFEVVAYDVNISGYGDTEIEAIEDVKEQIIDAFVRLNELTERELGPAPAKQKQVLNAHIERKPI